MKADDTNITDNFLGMVKNLSKDDKLELISQISESLKGQHEKSSKKDWKKLFGAFKSSQSAEEMIEELHYSRFINRNIEDL